MSKIAVMGMGAMGSRMAKALLEAGHELNVWNLVPEACQPLVELGATACDSPRHAAEGCEFAIAMVWDDQASAYVWLDKDIGALQAMEPGSIALECATLTIEHESKLYEAALSRGVEFASAPMSGSLPEADAKTLIFTVGAGPETFARVEPILMAMGSKINHAGGPLDGISLKLMINGKLAIEYAFAAELVALMQAAGMDSERRLGIASGTAPFAARGVREARFMLDGNEAVRVKVNQMIKDAENQIAQAKAHGAPCPMLEAAAEVFRSARDAGLGDCDATSLVRHYRSLAASAKA